MNADAQLTPPEARQADPLWLFLLLPTVAMSLGWALRGTIGGGQIGALIPGAMVMLCLCWLLRIGRGLGTIVAIGTVGIGLGGQETYGQTIGFLRSAETVLWGLSGLAIKGGMWGLSGGVLAGLGFMSKRYRGIEIAIGLAVMMGVTLLGIHFIDEPKLAYFSNRLDKPRDEVWVGVTLGALALVSYLLTLQRETVSAKFALAGLIAGAAGFGGGGLFIAYGATLPNPYSGWPWWKMMEFTFGALYGLGLGAIAYWLRAGLRDENAAAGRYPHADLLPDMTLGGLLSAGLIVAVAPLWLNFTIPHRAAWSLIAPVLILISLISNRLSWQIALSLTVGGFLRDCLVRYVKNEQMPAWGDDWLTVVIVTIPVVIVVALSELRSQLTAERALLGLAWVATLFGVIKIVPPLSYEPEKMFVPAMFLLELLLTTVMIVAFTSKQNGESNKLHL